MQLGVIGAVLPVAGLALVTRRVRLALGAPTGHPSLERVRAALQTYGFDPADLDPLPGQDRRSARYLVSSHSHPDLFVKVVTRERRDSDLLYRAWYWLKHHGRPPSRLGDAVAQVEHEATMGLLAATAGFHAPPVLAVRSFGNDAGLLVPQRVPGRDLTQLGGEPLDQAQLAAIWQQVAALRRARIAHRDLGLASVMVDTQSQGWLVDFDRAEAAATDQLLDRDLTSLLAALDGWPTRPWSTPPPTRPSARTRWPACSHRLRPGQPLLPTPLEDLDRPESLSTQASLAAVRQLEQRDDSSLD